MTYASTKRYAILGKGDPDITVVVRGIMKDQRITQRKLAKMVGWHFTTIHTMLKRQTWNIAELLAVGKALNHDLLQYYYPTPPEAQVPVSRLNKAEETIATLQKQLSEQELELLKLRTENALMREVLAKKN